MSSEIKADKWSPASGTAGTIGDSGDTFTVPSGVTLNTSSATLSIPSTVITGQTEKTSLVDGDKFLISDSAASGALKYVQNSNLGGGTHVKLLSGSASSAVNHDFTGFVDNTKYDNYLVQINNLVGTQGNEMSFQFGDSGGIEDTSNYWYVTYGRRSGGSDMENSGEGDAEAKLGTPLHTTVNAPGSYLFYLYLKPENKTFGNSVIGDNWGYRSDWSDYLWGHFTISYNVAITVDRFRIHASGNDATTFDYVIYGIAK
jgi:hypothetical protein